MPVEAMPPVPRRPRRRSWRPSSRLRWIIVGIGIVSVLIGGVLTRNVLVKVTATETADVRSPDASGSAAGQAATSPTPSTNPTGLSATALAPSSSPPPRSTLPGWPGPGNTGVPKGTQLRRSGSILVTQDNTVIDSLEVHGCIQIEARHVTIRRTKVIGSCARGTIGTPLNKSYGRDNVLIEDVEVDGDRKSFDWAAVSYDGFTCRRCNLHSSGTGARLGNRVLIVDSWIHDFNAGDGSHNNAIAGHGNFDVVLLHNWLECLSFDYCSSALAFFSDERPVHDVLVENNHLSGGSYCLYGGAHSGGGATNIKIRNNVFATSPSSKCGQYGPAAYWRPDPGNEWTGNHWDGSRKVVSPP